MDEEESKTKKVPDDGLKSPRFGSNRIHCVLDGSYRLNKVQAFKCESYDNKFYKRHIEDYGSTH
ncbi:MAG: hypothetical protein ACOC38_08585 [Promethearchaeia archaeon]